MNIHIKYFCFYVLDFWKVSDLLLIIFSFRINANILAYSAPVSMHLVFPTLLLFAQVLFHSDLT